MTAHALYNTLSPRRFHQQLCTMQILARNALEETLLYFTTKDTIHIMWALISPIISSDESSAAHQGLSMVLAMPLVVFLLLSSWSIVHWFKYFDKGRRFPRSHPMCPSHKLPQMMMKRSGEVTLSPASKQLSSLIRATSGRSLSPSSKMGNKSDMDHIYLPFLSFLWGMIFIWPVTVFVASRGIITLIVRCWLFRWCLISPKPFDPASACYNLCLCGTLAIHFVEFDDVGNVKYRFDDIPIINKNGVCEVKEILELHVDLKNKRLVSAVFNNSEHLSSRETLTILFFYLVSAHHVKLHSFANWAVNLEPTTSSTKGSSFVARNGAATVMYNYMGYTGFGDLFPAFQALSLLSPNFQSSALKEVFDYGINAGVVEHSNIIKLAKHSPWVNFIIKIRGVFIAEFVKHRHCFPAACNVEALFTGTILHSLDHSAAGYAIPDSLWFDVSCPKYGHMAELVRIVRVGFIDDLPGLAFHKSFRNSGHPFYEAVYKRAAKINKQYADQMDT